MQGNDTSDLQTLRLLKAFFEVTDPEAREIIVRLAEAASRPGTKIVTAPVIDMPAAGKLN